MSWEETGAICGTMWIISIWNHWSCIQKEKRDLEILKRNDEKAYAYRDKKDREESDYLQLRHREWHDYKEQVADKMDSLDASIQTTQEMIQQYMKQVGKKK